MYLKSVRKWLSVKTGTIINQLTGFYIAPKATSENNLGNFKIIEKSEIHYPCQ